jgi:hypothetical protein
MRPAEKLVAMLKSWRDDKTCMYEGWHNESIWELVDADPDGEATLVAEFEKLPNGELQKLHLAMLLLERYPCLAAYNYLMQARKFPPEAVEGSLYQGVILLKREGKIK